MSGLSPGVLRLGYRERLRYFFLAGAFFLAFAAGFAAFFAGAFFFAVAIGPPC